MRHSLLSVGMALGLGLLSCHSDDYQPSIKPNPDDAGNKIELAEAVSGRIVLGYATYYGAQLPNPSLVTHINYAFAEVYVKDGVYQGFKLRNEETFEKVVALKKSNPNLKVLISFNNNVENSDNVADKGFSAIAASEQNRKDFARDCLEFVRAKHIDGIDMDWEFPGMTWGSSYFDSVNDVDNYTMLMAQLRSTLGNSYLLTYAGYIMDVSVNAAGEKKYIDVAAVESYVDFVNLMTYDIDSGTKPQNALTSKNVWDITRTVNVYLTAGYPASKLVVGIPFYVRHSFASGGSVHYRDLNTLGSGYKVDNWDAEAQVPYVSLNGVYWGSYDNERSIGVKGKWAVDNGLAGLMYWEASEDDGKYTLSTAAWNAVMGN